MNTMQDNVDTMAKHYVDTINGKPNAWGQYISPIYGQCHHIHNRMTWLFGGHVTQLAINKELNK
jgi:hypothetical protein